MEYTKNYIKLNNGGYIPSVGFGTSLLTGNQCVEVIRKALNIGYRHIDTASAYENEIEIGKAIKESEVDRKELFITSKVWKDSMGYENTIKSCEASLQRLGIDYIDLFLIHWPSNKDNKLNIDDISSIPLTIEIQRNNKKVYSESIVLNQNELKTYTGSNKDYSLSNAYLTDNWFKAGYFHCIDKELYKKYPEMVIDYMYGTNVAEKKIIESVCKGIGLDIDNIYITNIIKCTEKETYKIEQCLNYLRNEVILVKPKIIILMGEIVIKSILGNNEIFSCGKGEFIQKKNINYMPTWHPVDFSNNIEKKIQFWNDYKKCYQNLTFYKN